MENEKLIAFLGEPMYDKSVDVLPGINAQEAQILCVLGYDNVYFIKWLKVINYIAFIRHMFCSDNFWFSERKKKYLHVGLKKVSAWVKRNAKMCSYCFEHWAKYYI